MKNIKKNTGFTLVEMLVVVAIIAILSGVVFTGIRGSQDKARDARRIANLDSVRIYLETYNSKCGHYPGITDTGRQECSATITNWADLTKVMTDAGVTSQLPQDPVPGRNYFYGVESPEGLGYILGAELQQDNNKLRDDIDATTFGVDCSDSPKLIYCIQS